MHTLHGSTASHHATWVTILLGSIQPGLRNHRDLPKHCILRHQNFTVASPCIKILNRPFHVGHANQYVQYPRRQRWCFPPAMLVTNILQFWISGCLICSVNWKIHESKTWPPAPPIEEMWKEKMTCHNLAKNKRSNLRTFPYFSFLVFSSHIKKM